MTQAGEKTFFGHPRGLSTLFLTEMWERFSYYGMRALLLLFMVDVGYGGMGIDTTTAGAIYGLYTFGVYALALPGGWIADRLVGQRKAVLYGGVLIAAGHYALAIPAGPPMFYTGLLLIVLGTGLLKPNVSAIVGDLYKDAGARRDAGFSIFYMGINLGAFAGPLICSFLGEARADRPEWVDWHYGFGAAGVGMTLALVQYVLGQKHLEGCGELKEDSALPEKLADARRKFTIGLIVVLGLIGAMVGLSYSGMIALTLVSFAQWTGVIVVILAVLYFTWAILFACRNRIERMRVGVCAALFVGAAMFWSGFEQAGSTLTLFASDYTRRVLTLPMLVILFAPLLVLLWIWVGTFKLEAGAKTSIRAVLVVAALTGIWFLRGRDITAGTLQSVNPYFIILFAPVMGMVWLWLGSRGPSIPLKFAYGLVLLGAGFLVLAWGATYVGDGRTVGMGWLVSTYFLHTIGELCLSPVGLSSMTKLAPPRLVGQMMGTWFMGAALGNLVAGLVTGYLEHFSTSTVFAIVAMISIGSGLVFLLLSPVIKKMCAGVN